MDNTNEGKTIRIRIMCLFLGFVLAVNLFGYEIQVDGFSVDERDLSARTEPRYDLNDRMCALIKVVLPQGAKFEGSVAYSKYDVNEYWVYVAPGTKFLNIKYPGFETISLSFPDFGENEGLQAGITYRLRLSGYKENGASVSQDTGANWLILDITPKTGITVKIDGQVETVENGQTMSYLKYGNHTYSVEAAGYESKSGTVNVVKGEKMKVPVRLSSIMGSLSITTETPGASIMVNGQQKGTGSWSGTLKPGLYQIEVSKSGYKTYTQSVEIAKNENKNITIPALNPVFASLNIAYRPIGAEVLLDGKPVGETPLLLNEVTTGNHTVTIQKNGYQKVTKNITLKENQAEELSGQLTQETAATPAVPAKQPATPSSGSTSTSNNPQEIVIKGKIFGTDKDEELIGAIISLVRGSRGTITDIDGNFTISVPATTKQIKVSYVGFKDKIINLNGDARDPLIVQMNPGKGEEIVNLSSGIKYPGMEGNIFRGTVTADGEAVIGATIINKTTGKGTLSDIDGNFILEDTQLGDTIEIIYIGYNTQKLTFRNRVPERLVVKMKGKGNKTDKLTF